MTVSVLYFAALRDLVGCSEETLSLPPEVVTLGQFIEHLTAVRPALLGKLGSVRFAINESFADTTQTIADGDVIAAIPPVSGG